MVLNTSNLIVAIARLSDPDPTLLINRRGLEIAYLMLAILFYIFIVFSYFKPKYMAKLTYISTVYITLRLSFRIIETRFIEKKDVD